jgi:peptidylprolyl isomerase
MKYPLLAVVAALLALPAKAQETAPAPSPGEIIDAAPPGDWIAISASDLLVMDLAPDGKGKGRRVLIQLMPAPFSQGWIGNIRKLAAAHWWDDASVNRVQDNYVAQWGDATEKKPLPDGLATVPERDYIARRMFAADARGIALPASGRDSYAEMTTFHEGWPIAVESDFTGASDAWPIHCYGAVGVGRDMSPDTGTGAELYAVIGHAPRHLDRNIAVVGRVIAGIEHLSSLPRGTGALGFYEDAADRVPILSIRIAGDLPDADQPKFEFLSTGSESFARYAQARANRRDPFFVTPAGGADVCNVPVPIRPVAAR